MDEHRCSACGAVATPIDRRADAAGLPGVPEPDEPTPPRLGVRAMTTCTECGHLDLQPLEAP